MECVFVCVYMFRSVGSPRKRQRDLTSLRKAGLEGGKRVEKWSDL